MAKSRELWLVDHPLGADVAAIHLIVEADDRRSAEVPADAVLGGAATDDLVRQERVEGMDRIDLRGGRLAPREAEHTHSTIHLAEHSPRLVAHPIRRRVARA